MSKYKNLTEKEIKNISNGTINVKLKDIDDDLILQLFVNKSTNKIGARIQFCRNKNIIKYLENRYPKNEFISLYETIMRILNKEEKLPKCMNPNCNNIVKNFRKGRKYCSSKCCNSDEIAKEKKVKSIQNKFGKEFTNCSQVPKIKKKKEETIKKHYGSKYKNPSEVPEIRTKIANNIKASNLKHYGVENCMQRPEVHAKVVNTMIKLYGVPYNAQRKEFWEQYFITRLKNGNSRKLKEKKEIRNYNKIVRFITEKVYNEFRDIINPLNIKRGKKYHLDHKFSVVSGFENGINIDKICMPYNLCIIPAKENMKKHSNSSIDKLELDKLFKKFKKDKKLYNKYTKILNMWLEDYD